ncbi:MAG: Ppx/GppA family phosphatase [Eggerthella lenta]
MSAIAEPESTESGFQAGRYAAIDIGTVTCRMLVADVDEAGRLHELDREYTITNLGEGVDATGVLKPAAMQRVADAVARFLDVLRGSPRRNIPPSRRVCQPRRPRATRKRRRVRGADGGLGRHAVRHPRRARGGLSFAGASCDFRGSACSWWTSAAARPRSSPGARAASCDRSHSFNIGCRRVTEKFFAADPPGAGELERNARGWRRMRPYFDELRGAGFAPERLVAVAGTATTVVSIHERMEVYDTSRVHKAVITRPMLDGVADQLERVRSRSASASSGSIRAARPSSWPAW